MLIRRDRLSNRVSLPGGIAIENDAWIGAGAIILDGVRIGQGAVVGAGAVVTHDVPRHTVVTGNPARVTKNIIGPQTSPSIPVYLESDA
jgi:acetyltransferase-like isoleucine patch superfamily enzyme